jgi:serine/threonine protein kinase
VRKKYRLDSLLGVGGMAAVYAATHRNGSRMAIKMLHAEFAGDDSVRERFLREGYVANKVNHPGRVEIFDDDETDQGDPFLVMELLEGQTLQQLWKKSPNRKLDVVRAAEVAEEVLDTLIPFHALNIIHRDLKPANIFITDIDEVKLLDFGVAQMREAGTEALTRAGSALGTPSYMSPEQAMGKSDTLDGRSDVYAMGATLYAVLSGHRLYHDQSDNEAFILAATQPAPSIARVAPELPIEAITLVDKALQWDRRNRFADSKAMRDACRELARAKRGGAGLAPSPSAAGPPSADGVDSRHMMPTPLTAPTALSAPGVPSSPLTPLTANTGLGPGMMDLSPNSLAAAGMPGSVGLAAQQGAISSHTQHLKLKEIFTLLERAMPTVRQYGASHPESISKIGNIHRTIMAALRVAPQGLSWTVHPFCFTTQGETIWEPSAPFDGIPYTLSAAGVEEIGWQPGITEQELRIFCSLLMVGMSPETADVDIAEQFWEARLEHVRVELGDDLAEADAAREERAFAETDDVEATAREDLAEAAAMAHATDVAGASAVISPALCIDPAARIALAGQLSLDPARWQDRYFDIIVAGYIDTIRRGDPAIVLGALAVNAERLIDKGEYKHLLATHHTLLERLAASGAPAEASAAMLTAGIYSEAVLKKLLNAAYDDSLSDGMYETIVQILRSAAATLDPRAVHGCIKLANRLPPGEPVSIMLEYIKRASGGQEGAIIEQLDSVRPAFAQQVLAAIANPKTAAGVALLKPLLESRIPALSCEAVALLAKSPEQLKGQLLKLAENKDPQIRMAALGAMVRHHVRATGPGLIRMVESDTFVSRPREEQKQIFETLCSLNSERGEALLISVIDQMHGLMADENVDRTRALAAEVLSERASSQAARQVLANATRRRPWNTPELRATATTAIARIDERMETQPDADAEA